MKEIRKTTHTPVIFASGNSDELHLKRASEISNSIFLVKPVTDLAFTDAVKGIEKE